MNFKKWLIETGDLNGWSTAPDPGFNGLSRRTFLDPRLPPTTNKINKKILKKLFRPK